MRGSTPPPNSTVRKAIVTHRAQTSGGTVRPPYPGAEGQSFVAGSARRDRNSRAIRLGSRHWPMRLSGTVY